MPSHTRPSTIETLESRTLFSIAFLPAVQSPVGSLGPMAAGDFTGDGLADVVALDTLSGRVQMYPGLGTGQFVVTGAFVPLDAGPSVVQLVAADVNRDGRLDVIAVNGATTSNAGGVTVLLNQGGPIFAAQRYAAGPSPTAVAVGDFNRDGRADLAVANDALWPAATPTGAPGYAAAVLYGTNAGFAAAFRVPLAGPTISVAAQPPMPAISTTNLAPPSAVAFAGPNLLVASPIPITTVFLFPAGSSLSSTVLPTTVSLPGENQGLAIADLNRDGRADVTALQALGANATNANAITVHAIVSRLATTTTMPAGYAVVGPFATGLSSAGRPGLAVADFDADGRADVAVAGIRPVGPMLPAFQGGAAVLTGRGGGYFGSPGFFATGAQPRSIAVAEVNRDRRPDLLTGSAGGVSALINRGATATVVRDPANLEPVLPDDPGFLAAVLE